MSHPNPAASYRILVVDDNVPSAQTMLWTLELLGHDVKMTHNGKDALELAKTFAPDVLLLDISLPDIDGYDLCGMMRQLPETQNAHIIAQTGWDQKEHRDRSKNAGFDHHLLKPIELPVLQDLLDSLKQKSEPLSLAS